MQVELIKATIEQKPLLANLLELYAYDFTEFCDFDIGDDGFYGYERHVRKGAVCSFTKSS